MIVITWNIQWSRGCDGVVDPRRIIRSAREFGDFDVLCLQEVARNYPGLEGSAGEDQFELLRAQLPGFTAIEAIATDVAAGDGRRRQFGNMILTRLPVVQAFRHLLPWPADPAVPSMQRSAVEVVVQGPAGPLRVTTTHLEYYSLTQRSTQVEALRALQFEAASHAADTVNREKEGGPFQRQPRPPSAILTADFNFRVEDPLYARLQAPLDGAPAYVDSWRLHHGDRPHVPTLGVFDKGQWPEPAFACDFIFVTADIASRVRDVRVDLKTQASDHQPVLLELS